MEPNYSHDEPSARISSALDSEQQLWVNTALSWFSRLAPFTVLGTHEPTHVLAQLEAGPKAITALLGVSARMLAYAAGMPDRTLETVFAAQKHRVTNWFTWMDALRGQSLGHSQGRRLYRTLVSWYFTTEPIRPIYRWGEDLAAVDRRIGHDRIRKAFLWDYIGTLDGGDPPEQFDYTVFLSRSGVTPTWKVLENRLEYSLYDSRGGFLAQALCHRFHSNPGSYVPWYFLWRIWEHNWVSPSREQRNHMVAAAALAAMYTFAIHYRDTTLGMLSKRFLDREIPAAIGDDHLLKTFHEQLRDLETKSASTGQMPVIPTPGDTLRRLGDAIPAAGGATLGVSAQVRDDFREYVDDDDWTDTFEMVCVALLAKSHLLLNHKRSVDEALSAVLLDDERIRLISNNAFLSREARAQVLQRLASGHQRR